MGIAGKAEDWKQVCSAVSSVPTRDNAKARRFFEHWFRVYAVNGGADGLFTGYYEAELNGSRERGGTFQTPLWTRPNDLITVDLGDFRPELKGQRIAGKVDGGKLKPYDDRASIARNGLNGRAEPLMWVDDPVAEFFLEIQGSGRVRMTDGDVERIGFDAQNGRTYVPIGKLLLNENELQSPVTMAKIRDWLKRNPDQAQAMMNRNPSVVFFRRLTNTADGPIGAEGVALTPMRSLAVDTAFVPLGVPLWLALPDSSRLVIAQDTGGAIKGPVRGDLFHGHGAEAETASGAMQSAGTYFMLLPITVVAQR